jgi:hypothetical protein
MMAEQMSYAYDAFVSYSHADGEWVRDWLVPRLKGASLRICIDGESFDIGVPSRESMERAVDASRHILLVLSPAWVESKWTRFEWAMARDQDPKNRARRILPLRLKACEPPEPIAALTYADLTCAEQAEAEFYKLLDAVRGVTRLVNSQEICKGLSALRELMQTPDVQVDVAAYLANFKAARDQMAVLGDLKDLHDQLHNLELTCYNEVVQTARRLPDDVMAWDLLIDYEEILQTTIIEVKKIASRGSVPASELSWTRHLAQAGEVLRSAIGGQDTGLLQKAIELLNHWVLAQVPSQLNARLNTKARDLRLPALVDALEGIHTSMVGRDLNAENVHDFKAGLDGLRNLECVLSNLVEDHDKWQVVETELRLVENFLERDISELEANWPGLKEMAEPLYSSGSDPAATGFKIISEKLEGAISAHDPVRIKQFFRSYRSKAAKRFYEVDALLKRHCNDLRMVGDPLATVLRWT